MSKFKTAAILFRQDKKQMFASIVQNLSFLWGDKKYLELMFRCSLGYRLDLNNPKTYNEKLQWLKLYDHNPIYTRLVDKHEVKSYVANKIGKQYVIPEIGIWKRPEEINWDILPSQFVLKTTHGGGNSGVVVCKDKANLDIDMTIRRLKAAMKQNLYKDSREWPYKNVPKRIIAEEYIEDDATKELRDYKFFCFDGRVEFLFIGSERQKPGDDVKFDFFDKDFNHMVLRQGHPNSKILPEKPSRFDEMKVLAANLSEGIPHVRIDLYEANGKVYFGEMTFYHFGGVVPFEPREWDLKFGKLIELPENRK